MYRKMEFFGSTEVVLLISQTCDGERCFYCGALNEDFESTVPLTSDRRGSHKDMDGCRWWWGRVERSAVGDFVADGSGNRVVSERDQTRGQEELRMWTAG